MQVKVVHLHGVGCYSVSDPQFADVRELTEKNLRAGGVGCESASGVSSRHREDKRRDVEAHSAMW